MRRKFISVRDIFLITHSLTLYQTIILPALHRDLNERLYGQHLVIEPLVKHLKAHAKPNPTKALALSLHGWTGTGKNYVSSIVAKHMYWKGTESKYVHLISATREFKHEHLVPQYKVVAISPCFLIFSLILASSY